MLRLSSNMTLVLRIALPCIYLSFFGLFILSIYFMDTNIAMLSDPTFRMVCTIVYFFFLLFIYFTVWRLRRVEYMNGQLFISSYFKNYRYDINDLSNVTEYDLFIAKIVKVTLKDKGAWGKHIYFLSKPANFASFKTKYPVLIK